MVVIIVLFPVMLSSSGAEENEGVPSLPPVALGLRVAEDSAGFLGTFGTLKRAWADEERYPSTLSSSSKLRSEGGRERAEQNHVAAQTNREREMWTLPKKIAKRI